MLELLLGSKLNAEVERNLINTTELSPSFTEIKELSSLSQSHCYPVCSRGLLALHPELLPYTVWPLW